MIYIVDTIQVEPKDTDKYLELVEKVGAPAMIAAGMTFVSCWATSRELGEDVSIQAVWSCRDHVQFNDFRKNMVLSPKWHEFADKAAAIRKGGFRRFYYPPNFSPMK